MGLVNTAAENPSSTRKTPSLIHSVTPGPQLLDSAAATLRMLAEPTRLHLLWHLSQSPHTVTELVDTTGASRTAVSQHLAKLRFSGLVDAKKDGRHVIYSVPDGHMVRLVREIVNHTDHQLTGEPSHD